MPPIVRLPYYPGEFAALVALHAACLPEEPDPAAMLRRFLRRRSRSGRRDYRVVKVLDLDGVLVASLLYRVTERACRVHRICVHPEYRRRGYGTLLLTHVFGARSLVRRPVLSVRVPERCDAALCFFRDLALEGRRFAFRGVRRDRKGALVVGYRLCRGCRARTLRVG